MLGQLPPEPLMPGPVFENISVDYAGPVYINDGLVCKPTIVKAYISVFVALSVKAVHLELFSDLTTEVFIATLRRFIAHRGRPSTIWSDHGTNFVGASREIKELRRNKGHKEPFQWSLESSCQEHEVSSETHRCQHKGSPLKNSLPSLRKWKPVSIVVP